MCLHGLVQWYPIGYSIKAIIQEFSYNNSIQVNNKSEAIPTVILFYKLKEYYPHSTGKETSPHNTSKLLSVSEQNQNEPWTSSYIFSTKAHWYLVENHLNHHYDKITFPMSTQTCTSVQVSDLEGTHKYNMWSQQRLYSIKNKDNHFSIRKLKKC